jgi:hypothetical protein
VLLDATQGYVEITSLGDAENTTANLIFAMLTINGKRVAATSTVLPIGGALMNKNKVPTNASVS